MIKNGLVVPDGARVKTAPQPRPVRSREVTGVEPHVEQLAIVAELMLGAAHADGDYAGVEIVAIGEQLKGFVEAGELPGYVRRRIRIFDPEAFDPEKACAALTFHDDHDKFGLLNLIATVTGADQVLHPTEEAYIRSVATAIGLNPDELRLVRK